jgi:hypothetical protein
MLDVASLIEGIGVAGFPLNWNTWTPTYSCEAGMTFTGVTTNAARYIQIGKLVFYYISFSGTTGGTAKTYLAATPPVTPANAFAAGAGYAVDNGVICGAAVQVSTTNIYARRYDSANFTLGAGRSGVCMGVYEAA